jgi:hypothetical protein
LGILHDDVRTFMIISPWNILKMRNVVGRICKGNQTTHLTFNNFLWDNVEKYGEPGQATDENITERMRFTYWITKATHTHNRLYIILTTFPRQQWLRERASVLRNTDIAHLVKIQFMRWEGQPKKSPVIILKCFLCGLWGNEYCRNVNEDFALLERYAASD